MAKNFQHHLNKSLTTQMLGLSWKPCKIYPGKIFKLLKHLKSNPKKFSKYQVVSYNIKSFLVYTLFQVVMDNIKSNPKKRFQNVNHISYDPGLRYLLVAEDPDRFGWPVTLLFSL